MMTEQLCKKIAELLIDNDCEVEWVMRELREHAFDFNQGLLSCLENYVQGKWLNKPIKVIFENNKNPRAYQSLIDAGYKTVNDLYRTDSYELRKLPHIGPAFVHNLHEWFQWKGLVGWW